MRNAVEASMQVNGAKLFNLLPHHLHDQETGTIASFKLELDKWLETIPDQPYIPDRQRAAASNSLLDQAAYQA